MRFERMKSKGTPKGPGRHGSIRTVIGKRISPSRLGFWLVLLVLGGTVAACSEDDPTGPVADPRIQVLLTDAPADMIEAADVWISKIYLVADEEDRAGEGEGDAGDDAEGEDEDGRVILFDDSDNPLTYDLLTLRDGVTADLTGEMAIPEGLYAQLRLVVDSAIVTLAGDLTFADGSKSRSLKVPSGSSSGIKVQLTEPLDADPGETTTILVDFDVNQNFVFQGNPDSPAGLQGVLFTPTLVEKDRTEESDDSDDGSDGDSGS